MVCARILFHPPIFSCWVEPQELFLYFLSEENPSHGDYTEHVPTVLDWRQLFWTARQHYTWPYMGVKGIRKCPALEISVIMSAELFHPHVHGHKLNTQLGQELKGKVS